MRKLEKIWKMLDLVKAKDNPVLQAAFDFLSSPGEKNRKEMCRFAGKRRITPMDMEDAIYTLAAMFFGDGKAKEEGFKRQHADSRQLKIGVQVELEHTSNSKIAERIALDHLAEIPDYYTRLLKMEVDARKR